MEGRFRQRMLVWILLFVLYPGIPIGLRILCLQCGISAM
jgi:hypothetical protein